MRVETTGQMPAVKVRHSSSTNLDNVRQEQAGENPAIHNNNGSNAMGASTKDQKKRQQSLDNRKEVECILIKMLTAFLIFATMATAFTVLSLSDANAGIAQCSITGAEFDNLMSEDMAAFTALNPGEYSEFDMD